jgi:hypothetical protein
MQGAANQGLRCCNFREAKGAEFAGMTSWRGISGQARISKIRWVAMGVEGVIYGVRNCWGRVKWREDLGGQMAKCDSGVYFDVILTTVG